MIEYEPIGWVNGEEAETTPLNADNLNHMDEGIQAATNYLSETRDIADDTAERLALQIARLDVIVANMSTNTRTLTQAEYDSLTEAEKNNNTIYFISDGGMNDTTKAASIEYDNERSGLTGETVQAAIDELNSRLGNHISFNLTPAYTSSGTINNMSYGIYFESIGLVAISVNVYDSAGDIPKQNNPILTIPSQYRPIGGVSGFLTLSSDLVETRIERGGIASGNIVLNNFATGTTKMKLCTGILIYGI